MDYAEPRLGFFVRIYLGLRLLRVRLKAVPGEQRRRFEARRPRPVAFGSRLTEHASETTSASVEARPSSAWKGFFGGRDAVKDRDRLKAPGLRRRRAPSPRLPGEGWGERLCCWSSVLPWSVVADDGVEDGEEFSGCCDEGDHLGLSGGGGHGSEEE